MLQALDYSPWATPYPLWLLMHLLYGVGKNLPLLSHYLLTFSSSQSTPFFCAYSMRVVPFFLVDDPGDEVGIGGFVAFVKDEVAAGSKSNDRFAHLLPAFKR